MIQKPITIKVSAHHPFAKALKEALKEKEAFRKAAESGKALEYIRYKSKHA